MVDIDVVPGPFIEAVGERLLRVVTDELLKAGMEITRTRRAPRPDLGMVTTVFSDVCRTITADRCRPMCRQCSRQQLAADQVLRPLRALLCVRRRHEPQGSDDRHNDHEP